MKQNITTSYILSTLKNYAQTKSSAETLQCFVELFSEKFNISQVGIWKLNRKDGIKNTEISVIWSVEEQTFIVSRQEAPLALTQNHKFTNILESIDSSVKKNTLIKDKKNWGFYSGLYVIAWEQNGSHNEELMQMFCEVITNSLPVYFQLAKLKKSTTVYMTENTSLKKSFSPSAEVLSRSQLNYSYQNIQGHSRSLLQVLNYLDRIIEYSDQEDIIYISGESGTGKSLIARSIHKYSSRCNEPFIEVNCGAIIENLAEAEFFGIASNSGISNISKNGKLGLFELAHKGVLFLDEVSELSLSQQSALLTVIEGKPFRRVCGNDDIYVDIQIITASIRDIKKLPSSQFLPELAERLDGIRIQIPPLRERVHDIPTLINYFCENIRHEDRRKNITPALKAAMLSYDWPGNIRQLNNCIRRCSFGIIPEYLKVPQEEMTVLKTFEESLVESKEQIIKDRISILLADNPKSSFGDLALSLGLSRDSLRRRLQSISTNWEDLRKEFLSDK